MAGNDIYLYQVPSDTDSDDVRLRDPTAPAVSGITATLAVTEADDTLSSAAKLAITATLAVTEAGDTLSATAALAIAANLAIAEADDTLSAAAKLAIAATLAVTEADDALSSAAVLPIVAGLAVTEADDTLSSTASVSGAVVSTGGGAIVQSRIVRRYREPELEDDLDRVLKALRRPPERAKRKKAIKLAEGVLRELVASVEAAPKELQPPLAIGELRDAIGAVDRVESGVMTPAEWRVMVLKATQQALAEMHARRMMVEEEKAVMTLFLMAA